MDVACVDVVDVCNAALHSPWLLLILVVLIAIDGPVPMLRRPSRCRIPHHDAEHPRGVRIGEDAVALVLSDG